MLVIKIAFDTARSYGSMAELAKRLGIGEELRREGYHTEFITKGSPKLKFKKWGGKERAIFFGAEEKSRYYLLLPINGFLYDRIYSTLKSKNMKLDAEMVNIEELDVLPDEIELLKWY